MTTALLDGQTTFASSTAGAGPGPSQCVGLNRKVVTLSSAQILALQTGAITLIPAPGAGFMLIPVAILLNFVGGSVAYTDAGGAVSFAIGTWSQALANNNAFTGTANLNNHQIVNFAALATAAAPPTNENAALTIGKATNNFAAGNGTASVVILYFIEPIAPTAN